jgi:hypothetical protein
MYRTLRNSSEVGAIPLQSEVLWRIRWRRWLARRLNSYML